MSVLALYTPTRCAQVPALALLLVPILSCTPLDVLSLWVVRNIHELWPLPFSYLSRNALVLVPSARTVWVLPPPAVRLTQADTVKLWVLSMVLAVLTYALLVPSKLMDLPPLCEAVVVQEAPEPKVPLALLAVLSAAAVPLSLKSQRSSGL